MGDRYIDHALNCAQCTAHNEGKTWFICDGGAQAQVADNAADGIRACVMNGKSGPVCWCGRPSRHQSGECGGHDDAR